MNSLAGDNLRPLRICFVADSASIHTVRWVRFFAERGHQLAIVSQEAPHPSAGIGSYYSLARQSATPGSRILRNASELRSAIKDFNPDVLHAHYINEYGWLGALSGFHPFVLTAWGSDVYLAMRQSRLARFLTPWSVRRCDYLTADSQSQLDQLHHMGASSRLTELVTWGVDFDEIRVADGRAWRGRYGIDSARPVILSPRQWIANSNIDVILEAFAQARAGLHDALLVLKNIADTPEDYRRNIEDRIRTLGVGESVLVVGEVPAGEVPDMYAAADITISVATSDGTPVSVLEAMAGGSAVIASKLPDLAEWIQDGVSGYLVDAHDAPGLAAGMALLLGDGDLRRALGMAARQIVRQRGDRSKNLARVEGAYRRLAHSTSRR